MKNNLRNIFLASIGALTIGVAMLSLSGCNDPTPGPATGCAAHNNDKTTCVATTGANGKMCEYKDATNECVEGTVTPVVCKDLTPDNCKASKVCTFKENENPPVCQDADAAKTGKCEAIQVQGPCDNDSSGNCSWDATAKECKTKGARQGGLTGLTYLQLTFKEKVAAGKASAAGVNANSENIVAIGRNGDGSRVYFGTDKKGEINMLDVGNDSVVNRVTKPDTASNKPGEADLARIGDSTEIKKIIAGPGSTAVAIVSGLNTIYGGVIFLVDSEVKRGWYATDAHLGIGTSNVNFSALALLGDHALIFANNIGAKASAIDLTEDIPNAASGLHKGNGALGLRPTSATTKGNDLYLGNSSGFVYKFGGIAATDDIDPTNVANQFVKPTDLVIDGGGDNKEISTLGVVGDDLLVGIKAGTGKNAATTGGIAVVNLTDPTKKKAPALASWSIWHIAVSADNKAALISTDKGLVLFYKGVFTEINDAKLAALQTANSATAARPVEFAADAKPATFNLTTANGAAHIGSAKMWYVGTAAGIYKIKMEEKTK